MNKAFVREPDDRNPVCPHCGAMGMEVRRETLDARLKPESRSLMGETAYYCPTGSCDVAYFDAFERVALAETVVRLVYPKDPLGPICPCFGVTLEDLVADIREGGATRIKELIAKAQGPDAHCAMEHPSGQSCVTEARRIFLRLKSESAGG